VKRFLPTAALVLVLDQASKWLAHRDLAPRGSLHLLGDLVRLHYARNAGAAFSLFQGSWALFVGISIVSIAVIFYLVLSRRYVFPGSSVAFGLVLGGALGNLIDRLWLRQVIDFIDIGLGAHRWPTFNVADIGVTLGVLYLAIGFLWLDRKVHPASPAAVGDGHGAAEKENAEPDHV